MNKSKTTSSSKKTLNVKKKFKISNDDMFKRSPEILSRNNSDGSVAMIHANSDKNFYTLDGIAANVWQMLDGKSSLQKIKAKLSQKYSADLEDISRDTDDLIEKLFNLNLIFLKKA